jgi:hypothetical protein
VVTLSVDDKIFHRKEVNSFFYGEYVPRFKDRLESVLKSGGSVDGFEKELRDSFVRDFKINYEYSNRPLYDFIDKPVDICVSGSCKNLGNMPFIAASSKDLLFSNKRQRPQAQAVTVGGFSSKKGFFEDEVFACSDFLDGCKFELDRAYMLRKRVKLGLSGCKAGKHGKERPHALTSGGRVAVRGNLVNMFRLYKPGVHQCWFETFSAPNHTEFAADSREFENAFVDAMCMFRKRVRNLRSNGGMSVNVFAPEFFTGITERQPGARKVKGAARGAVHYHGVGMYRHVDKVPYFAFIQNLRFLSCLREYGFEVLSEAGKVARDRRDPDFENFMKYFDAHKYVAIVSCECFDGVQRGYLTTGDYNSRIGKYTEWLAQPIHMQHFSDIGETTPDKLCAYMVKYFGDKSSLPGIFGKVDDLVNKVRKDLGQEVECKSFVEGLYRRRIFAKKGLRLTSKELTRLFAGSVGLGFDNVTYTLGDEILFSGSEVSKMGLKGFYLSLRSKNPKCENTVRVTTKRNDRGEIEFVTEFGVPMDFTDDSVGSVIWNLDAGKKTRSGKPAINSLRKNLFADAGFSDSVESYLVKLKRMRLSNARLRRLWKQVLSFNAAGELFEVFECEKPLLKAGLNNEERRKKFMSGILCTVSPAGRVVFCDDADYEDVLESRQQDDTPAYDWKQDPVWRDMVARRKRDVGSAEDLEFVPSQEYLDSITL